MRLPLVLESHNPSAGLVYLLINNERWFVSTLTEVWCSLSDGFGSGYELIVPLDQCVRALTYLARGRRLCSHYVYSYKLSGLIYIFAFYGLQGYNLTGRFYMTSRRSYKYVAISDDAIRKVFDRFKTSF